MYNVILGRRNDDSRISVRRQGRAFVTAVSDSGQARMTNRDMRIHYDQNRNTFTIILSEKKIDHFSETEFVRVGMTDEGKPVEIKFLDAEEFFRKLSKVLPKEIKQKFFSASA